MQNLTGRNHPKRENPGLASISRAPLLLSKPTEARCEWKSLPVQAVFPTLNPRRLGRHLLRFQFCKPFLAAGLVGTALLAQTSTAPKRSTSSAAHSTASKPAAATKPAAPMTDDQKVIYALGLSIYRSLGQFDLTPAELDIVKRALNDAQAGKPAEEIQTWGPKIQGFAQARQKAASQEVLAKAAAQPGAVKTDSGLIYRDITPGTGPSPTRNDTVKVNYRGTLPDGNEFDSSYKRNAPAEFPLSGVIPCWTEGVQKMKVGGKAQLVCPASLAYGDHGQPGIPGGAVLTFEVELLGITPAANAPAAPPAPQTPPAPQMPPPPQGH